MTRRERLEAKHVLRREWAEKREAKATAAFTAAHKMTECIPMGQPILVGHHSEGRHRALLARSDGAMRRGCESAAMASHHESKASGIESQLDGSIFSDDPEAVEAIEARIAGLEAEREKKKRVAASWRKAKKPKADDLAAWQGIQAALGLTDSETNGYRRDCRMEEGFLNRGPVPGYSLSNLGGNITRLRKRLADVKNRQARTVAAEESADGVVIEGTGDYIRVTFAEKPDRSILEDLKAAGFHWGSGSWAGRRDALPESVKAGAA